MTIKIVGTCEKKPTVIIEFFENGHSLIYIEGEKPYFCNGLTINEAKQIIKEAGYSIKIERKE